MKMSITSITYVTYQTFPAETANSQQTISNIKYFVKSGVPVSLYFPLRESKSSSNLQTIQDFYSIDETFAIFGIKHFLPFGKVRIFQKFFFHVSHYLWSIFVVNKYFKKNNSDSVFFTRSEWIAYFLANKNHRVIFECHQTSKLRNALMKKLKKKENIKFIFLNEYLKDYYNLQDGRDIVLHNGVDDELFTQNLERKERLIFVGSLSRFNKTRNVNFLIKCFKESELLKKYTLSIVGGPDGEAEKLLLEVEKNNLSQYIKIHGRLDRKNAIKEIQKSTIGILLNSSQNLHSFKYTSPLKYFEYLYGGLNIIANNFPANKVLPHQDKIQYFEEESVSDFVKAFNASITPNEIKRIELKDITLRERTRKILKLY